MISLDKNWDLSAAIQQKNQNNEKFQITLPGRFDPSTVTAQQIEKLTTELINKFTSNTYIDTNITAHRLLNDILNEGM